VNPLCVGCDHVTPAPAGRIGVNQASVPTMVLPLVNQWVTGAVDNTVAQPGNLIDGRAVGGVGAILGQVSGGDYEVAACGAQLQVATPLGISIDIQFMTKQLWSPAP
jgi:hypothetical protein